MTHQNFKSISPLDGRYYHQLEPLSDMVSEFALMKYRLKVEISWFKFLFKLEQLNLPKLLLQEENYLHEIYQNFDYQQFKLVKDIESVTNHDVKAIEYYIKNKLDNNPIINKYKEFVHFAATSEDINNLSYALMLKDIKSLLLEQELLILKNTILELANKYKNQPMMSRTHGQPASPTTVGKELFNVYYRLDRQIRQLEAQELLGKMNGAVGNFNAHFLCYPNIDWCNMAKIFVEQNLNIKYNPYTTQIEPHDYMAEFFDNIRRINTILIDFSRDMWGYISIDYFKQKTNPNEVGSSTMPHKVNPIDFENCEGNLGLANALLTHFSEKLPISRWQRDLSDSTVLRNIGVAISYGILAYKSLVKGLNKTEVNTDKIEQDLDNQPQLLTEAIQVILRKHHIEDAYEQLKAISRGKNLTLSELRSFINQLNIPNDDKILLLNLDTKKYIGLANQMF
jgi:adenylosuccinate lyase